LSYESSRFPSVAAWPEHAFSPPRYRRRRYRYAANEKLLVAEGESGDGVAAGETVLRLAEVPLDDGDAVLAFANEIGTVGMSEDAESQTVAEFILVAETMRDAVTAWRVLQEDETLPAQPTWHLPRLHGVPPEELAEAAAEFVTVVLDTGLASVRPRVSVGLGSEPPRLDLTLYALCSCELFNHVVARNDFRVCANEACGRLLFRDETDRRRGVLYCSRTCAHSEAQPEFGPRATKQPTEGTGSF
jgi:hypothetical protein